MKRNGEKLIATLVAIQLNCTLNYVFVFVWRILNRRILNIIHNFSVSVCCLLIKIINIMHIFISFIPFIMHISIKLFDFFFWFQINGQFCFVSNTLFHHFFCAHHKRVSIDVRTYIGYDIKDLIRNLIVKIFSIENF